MLLCVYTCKSFLDIQKLKLAKTIHFKIDVRIFVKLKHEQLHIEFPLLSIQRQINELQRLNKGGLQIKISREQMRKQGQSGGFLNALAGSLGRTVLPMTARIAPKI